MKEVLDFLQTIYPVRLNPKDIPSILQEPFNKAARRFQNPAELKNLKGSHMGICEETADLTYQLLKMICLKEGILNDKTIRILENHLEQNGYYDAEKRLMGLDYRGLDALSNSLVPQEMIIDLRRLLVSAMFIPGKDDGHSILRDFLGGQFVAYISRIWRGHALGGLQAVEHMRDKKIPEEAKELIEALGSEYEMEIQEQVAVVRTMGKTAGLFLLLVRILKEKMAKAVTIEDTLQLMFLKMKGRQELDFMAVPEQTMRYICKPAEYLIEADMFF